MNKRKVKKNQHYVPQSYLRRFTIEGEKSLLWEFDKKSSRFKKNTSSVNKVCSEDYYYYQQDANGGFDHITIEDSLSEVEKIGNDILIKIINSRAMPYTYLTEEERGHISFYIALMLTRGPSFRDCINEMHGELVWSRFNQLNTSGNLPKMPTVLEEAVRERGLKNVIKAEIFSSVSLEYMVEAARRIALSLIEKQWTVIVISNDDEFLTSDNPVIFTSYIKGSDHIGPAHPNSHLTFPISKKIAMIMSGARQSDNIENRACVSSEVRTVNRLVLNAANKSIFCSKKYSWIENQPFSKTGQRMQSSSVGGGYEIIHNPYVRR